MERHSVFALDSARALYWKATSVDPSFLPAHLDYFTLMEMTGRWVELRAEYAGRDDVPRELKPCLVALTSVQHSNAPASRPVFRTLRATLGPSACVSFGLALTLRPTNLRTQPQSEEELSAARAVAAEFPESAASVRELLQSLESRGMIAEAIRAARDAARSSPHILQRLWLNASLARLLELSGDTVSGRAVARSAESAALQDGRRFVRFSLYAAFNPRLLGADHEHVYREQLRLVREAGSRAVETTLAQNYIGYLVDAGRFEEALSGLKRPIAFADSADMHTSQLRLRLLEGRALARSGHHEAAARALSHALPPAERLGSAYFIAEVHHQLAHAYEGMGRWKEAAAAADAFVHYAQQTFDRGLRVISYHDAATVRWKAGWHAAADSLSRMMVRAIEREQAHFAYAGEYFERIGDLGRAAAYFRLAAAPDPVVGSDVKVAYAGLTRLHLALGNSDSALATALVHDSLSDPPHDEILAPRALAAGGRPAEALAAMRRWSARQASRGNVRGQARSLLSLGEVLLEMAPSQAESLAVEAERLAARNNLTPERIAALRMRGQAAALLGGTGRGGDTAIALLSRAREASLGHTDVIQRILVEVALADALAASGRPEEALAVYGSAITLIERSGSTLSDDVNAARFRAARVQAFDGALRAVLTSGGEAPDVEQLLHWSARKKSRVPPAAAAKRVTVPAIQSRLNRDAALIDYFVVDTAVWAVVVTKTSVAVLQLPIRAPAVDSLSGRIVAPFTAIHAGRLDLARAVFDAHAARQLYDGLLRPLTVRLSGVKHLVIVPDAPLHAVPFDALVTESTSSGHHFVLDRWTIRYALAPVWRRVGRTVRPTDEMLLVVGDAPGAEAERDLVRRAWEEGAGGARRGAVAVLEGMHASETNLKRLAPRYPMIHIASHAHSDDRDPLKSHLMLQGDVANDGMLHYTEIEAARFAHSLVVLNACETSAGKLLAGSGFMSLARAFLLNGSSAVIATRWPVGSASATLSARLYALARRDIPLHQALHDAKVKLRKDSATAHPFYWASHILLQPF